MHAAKDEEWEEDDARSRVERQGFEKLTQRIDIRRKETSGT